MLLHIDLTYCFAESVECAHSLYATLPAVTLLWYAAQNRLIEVEILVIDFLR